MTGPRVTTVSSAELRRRGSLAASDYITAAWVYDDGGRKAAGFRGETDAGDCVVRAIAIAFELPYRQVYDDLAAAQDGMRYRGRGGKMYVKARSARDGVLWKAANPYLRSLGAVWTPTMTIGSGCRVHLRPDELPPGRIIAKVSKHLVAVIDGVCRDTYDPSRGGTRCVYGIWTVPS